MFIPYGSDAPMQRPPIGTFALVAANVVLFFLQENVLPRSVYVLSHGDGLHPVQWLVSGFAHSGPCHLIGNMFFLLAFGMVIESVIKCWQLIVVFVAMTVIQNGMEQILTVCNVVSSHSGSLGASGAIFGLMMMGILLAPGRNVLAVWIFHIYFYVRIVHLEIPVAIMALFYFFVDFGMVIYLDFAMSTPWLHATGALIGVLTGLAVYWSGWCEGERQDLFSLLSDSFSADNGVTNEAPTPTNLKPIKKHRFGQLEKLVPMLDRYLDGGHYELALNKLKQIHADHGRFQLSERQLVKLTNLSIRKSDNSNAMKLIKKYLNRFDTFSDVFRLQQARLLFLVFKAPLQAARELQRVDANQLNAGQLKLHRELKKRIHKAIPSQTKRWRTNDDVA